MNITYTYYKTDKPTKDIGYSDFVAPLSECSTEYLTPEQVKDLELRMELLPMGERMDLTENEMLYWSKKNGKIIYQ